MYGVAPCFTQSFRDTGSFNPEALHSSGSVETIDGERKKAHTWEGFVDSRSGICYFCPHLTSQTLVTWPHLTDYKRVSEKNPQEEKKNIW